MLKRHIIFILLLISLNNVAASEPFAIRGMLPWHNFLAGPSAWNEADYRTYLDQCAAAGINFIGFHNYTGGGERYATYVEPMIKIQYHGIVPQAYFDNSLTSRWGYLPMSIMDFAFGSSSVLNLPNGANAFGCDISITAQNTAEQYKGAQKLMRKVLKMAHERGIKMAMGFEFGVLPPEYYSLHDADNCFYWNGEATMLPNPTNQTAIELHEAALSNLLQTYPDIDYIWLWLNEHCFMSIDTQKALCDSNFLKAYAQNCHYFQEATNDKDKFMGVWALEYMKRTIEFLKKNSSNVKIILGGWGGSNQLPSLLLGLDRALPHDIIFSCLNPDLGKSPQPTYLADIARHRKVWAMPWLEGDHQLWHFQPRVDMMRKQVSLAAKQGLDGVVAIHWRTKETRFNFKTFSRYANDKHYDKSTADLYAEYLTDEFGHEASQALAPLITQMDETQLCWNVASPEYYAFTPQWGMLDKANRELREQIVRAADRYAKKQSGPTHENLIRFANMFRFELLLDQVDRKMQPAYLLKKETIESGIKPSSSEIDNSQKELDEAPIKEMFEAYVNRVDSRGEQGVLCSINQRLWREYMELKAWLINQR